MINPETMGGSQGGSPMMGGSITSALAPMLRMFGMDPDEQSTNIKALAAELKGDANKVKAQAQYTPEFIQMFQRLMQQSNGQMNPAARPGMPMGIPGNLTPEMARSLLRTVYE